MNSIDAKKMAQGALYGFTFTPNATDAQIKALIEVKDILRKARLMIAADYGGQLHVLTRDERRHIATNTII